MYAVGMADTQARVNSLKFVNYTIIENAHKVRKKSSFFMWLLYVQPMSNQNRYGLVCAVMINPLELPTNDKARNEAYTASTGVRRY